MPACPQGSSRSTSQAGRRLELRRTNAEGACAEACPEPVFDRAILAFEHRASSARIASPGAASSARAAAMPARRARSGPARLGGPALPEIASDRCNGCGPASPPVRRRPSTRTRWRPPMLERPRQRFHHISSAVASAFAGQVEGVLASIAELPETERSIASRTARRRSCWKAPARVIGDRLACHQPDRRRAVGQHGVRADRRPETLDDPGVTPMTLSRREMLKAHAAGVAALAANMSVPAEAQPVTGGVDSLQIKWSKASPLLRHRLRRHGWRQGRQGHRHPWRHEGRR